MSVKRLIGVIASLLMNPCSMSVAIASPVLEMATIAPLAKATVKVKVQIVSVGKPSTFVALSSPAEMSRYRRSGRAAPVRRSPGRGTSA